MSKKSEKRSRLKVKIRTKVRGVEARPRLSVFRSNKFIYAQVIDDVSGKTLAEASDIKMDKGTKVERAKKVGAMIAEVCKKKGIGSVVFDRNGFKYTGRVKLVAEAAREAGIKF